MAKVHILLKDFSLTAVASSSNEEPDALTNLIINERPSRRWRTLNLTTIQATVDAGAPQPWDSVFFGYTNATDVATLRVTSNDDAGTLFSAPSYDSGAFTLRFPGVGEFISWHAFHEAGSTQTFRYVGLEVSDPTNPDGYFTAGVVAIGNLFTPSLDAELGSSRGYVDTSISIEMSNGETVKRRRPRKQSQRISWRFQNENDSFFFANLARTYGESTPFVVKKDPEQSVYGHNLLVYGFAQYRESATITDQAPYGFDEVDMTITEV